jgi:putative endonuclease
MHRTVHSFATHINVSDMFHYVYILRSLKDNKFYVGYTVDLRKRFKEHQEGIVASTKSRTPFELIFYEAYRNNYDAMGREKYLKTSKGKNTLRQMLKEFLKMRINNRKQFSALHRTVRGSAMNHTVQGPVILSR